MAATKAITGITFLFAEVILLNASGINDEEIGCLLDEKVSGRQVRRYKTKIMNILCEPGFRDMSTVVQKVTHNGLLKKWMKKFALKHPKAVARLKKKFKHKQTKLNGEPFYIITPEEPGT